MLKRIFGGLLVACLLLSCAACAAKIDLEEVKTDMIESLQLTPVTLDGDQLAQWYGITADNCEQAVAFMLTEDLCPGEIVMVKANTDDDAALIAAAISRRLSSLKTQVSGREACTVVQDGKLVTMFFSQQHDALQTIYNDYL